MRANDINLKRNSVKSFENNVRKFCKINILPYPAVSTIVSPEYLSENTGIWQQKSFG